LSDADLSRANLRGADLRGADLRDYVYIKGSQHDFQYIQGHITIGCEYHSLEYWLIAWDIIGKKNGYTEEQLKEYKNYIDFCKTI